MLARLVIRFISGRDVPGAAFQQTRSSDSLKLGDIAGVEEGQWMSPASTIAPTAAYAQIGR